MTEREPYPTAAGVESAIKDAAKKASAAAPSLGVNKRIQLEYFNRFLSRVFSEGNGSEWVLKGGTGVLARVASTRATRDIDLCRQGFTLTQALDDLIRLAALDLRDHFRFEYTGHTNSIGNNAQPYTEGYQVKFSIFIGLSAKGSLQVDLAVGAGITGNVTITDPATALDLPRLVSHQYRLYPLVDQIADKVCATMTEYSERASSREKDLVDLVVFATTQDIDDTALHVAIATEARRRQMEPFAHSSRRPRGGSATPSSQVRALLRRLPHGGARHRPRHPPDRPSALRRCTRQGMVARSPRLDLTPSGRKDVGGRWHYVGGCVGWGRDDGRGQGRPAGRVLAAGCRA